MTQKTKRKNEQNQQVLILLGIGVAALIAVGLVIVFGSTAPVDTVDVDYSAIPQGRAADGGYVIGDPDAPVTIVAFEDFLCPHCQDYQSTVKEFIKKYVATGKARFEFRMLPTNNVSPQSMAMAQCADELRENSFWDAHDILFRIASSERYSNSSNRKFAEEIGIPYADLLECAPDATQQDVDTALARQVNVTGTPAILVRFGDSGIPTQHPTLGPRPGMVEFDKFFTEQGLG